jgi:succinate dehydrogenase / fumarate reductase, membrane anchor subunit
MIKADQTNGAFRVKPNKNYETLAWEWMRYSGFLLILLAFGHVILQDVLVGSYGIDRGYVFYRWMNIGWRIYEALLLIFAFAHGVNGARQVAMDYIQNARWKQILSWALLAFWLIFSLIGAIALIGGVRSA